jgi:hypothetical protein
MIQAPIDDTIFKAISYTFTVSGVSYSSKSLKIKVTIDDTDHIADFIQVNFQSS